MAATKYCENCGKAFESVDPDEGFCSDWCRKSHDREETTVVISPVSGSLVPVRIENVNICGSPALAINGRAVLWYENWVRAQAIMHHAERWPR